MKFLTIGELSNLTQVNSITLRAWERRYGLLKPVRSEKGHRLYAESDVERVAKILAWVKRGVSVGKVKTLLEENHQNAAEESITPEDNGQWQLQIDELLINLGKGQVRTVSQLVQQGFLQYPPAIFEKYILEPAIKSLNDQKLTGQFIRLQSILLGYTIKRLESSQKSKSSDSILLIHGPQTPVWRLAIMALQLADLRWDVELVIPPCDERSWIQLALDNKYRRCVIYQDGRWSDELRQEISNALINLPNLMLCGSAALLSGVAFKGRIATEPEHLINALEHTTQLKQMNE